MRDEIMEAVGYLQSTFSGWVKPSLAFLWSILSAVMFPDQSYIPAACALGGAMVLDILTKYYALRKPHGSLLGAIKAGSISSDSFFRGTKKKLVSFLTIMILCGLSVRVSPIAGVAVFLSTLAYAVMFLREAQSCVENLIQAGHDDLNWLSSVLRKKQETILKSEGVTIEKECIEICRVTEVPKREGDSNGTI